MGPILFLVRRWHDAAQHETLDLILTHAAFGVDAHVWFQGEVVKQLLSGDLSSRLEANARWMAALQQSEVHSLCVSCEDLLTHDVPKDSAPSVLRVLTVEQIRARMQTWARVICD
ncbi:MAG: hypothetical protein J4F97_02585 [Pseudomonadales bacterium]|nr:hypothetical protein [Pseudomonadales bacterium]